MAPFTHINRRGSRFSDGSYGIYYAAEHLETAVRATVYHFSRFAADSHDPPRREDMRVLLGSADCTLDDLSTLHQPYRSEVLDKNSYAASQPFGAARRVAASDGLSYPSVRHAGGQCIAAFWPNVVAIPIQERHLKYEWDGNAVTRYFDFKEDTWVPLV